MDNQIKQLKLNVKNIRSILVKSNKELYGIGKNKNSIRKRISSRDNALRKEKKLERPSTRINKQQTEKKVSSSSNPLEMLFGAGILLGAGVIINAAGRIKKVFDHFKEDNKPLFDMVGAGLTTIYNGITGIFNSFTGPESKEGAFDWLGKFDDSGNITGGLLKDLENAYDGLDRLIFEADKVLGGKSTLAKMGGVEGRKSQRTGIFVPSKWTKEERERYTSGSSDSNIPLDTKGGYESTGDTDRGHGAGGGGQATGVQFDAGGKGKNIFLHWTAGGHNTPFSAYHTTFLGDGKAVRYTPYSQDKNSHTGGANSNSVGLSIAAMGGEGVGENNFGAFPPTNAQLNAITLEAAKLALKWGWSSATIDQKVRTHGEWERYGTRTGKLSGSPQRWDLDKLRQSDPNVDTSKVLSSGGNELRNMIKQHLRSLKAQQSRQNTSSTSLTSLNTTESRANSLASNGPTESENATDNYILTGNIEN